jgi:hypothetical protein
MAEGNAELAGQLMREHIESGATALDHYLALSAAGAPAGEAAARAPDVEA